MFTTRRTIIASAWPRISGVVLSKVRIRDHRSTAREPRETGGVPVRALRCVALEIRDGMI